MASGMRPFQPTVAELPPEVPVFPLPGALVLPGGRLPLNVFEPRYIALVEDSLKSGRMFGMIQPDAMKPEGERGPALFRVGCLGRITSFAETEDGRIVLSLLGMVRFAVVDELPGRAGYRRLAADYTNYLNDLALPIEQPGFPREALLAALRDYFDRQNLTADWGAVGALDDHSLLTTLCMMCPFSTSEKQALLEAHTLWQRFDILSTLLAFGLHGLDDEGGTPRLS